MKRLLILGSGTFALETLDIAEAQGVFEPVGFVNSWEVPEPGCALAGLPVYWVDDIPSASRACVVAAGIVSTKRRHFVETMEDRGYRFEAIVHPSAIISARATVEPGAIVNAGVVISQNAHIESHAILNRGSLIGHDTRIGRFCTIGPGSNLAGSVAIGMGAYLGIGALIRDHVSIGAGALVGAGAVVTKSVPSNVMVVGAPARVCKTDVDGM